MSVNAYPPSPPPTHDTASPMNTYSPTSYHSPEKLFFAASLILCLLLGAYAWRHIHQELDESDSQTGKKLVTTTEQTMKIDAIRWLAPFKTMNYPNSPFDIRLRLKPQPPTAKIMAVTQKQTMPKPKNTTPPQPKTPPTPQPLPSITYSLQYRGHYTNLTGIHYAMFHVKNLSDGKEENLVMTKRQAFMDHFKLLDFDDSNATVGVNGAKSLTIPWNENVECTMTPSGQQTKADELPQDTPSNTKR